MKKITYFIGFNDRITHEEISNAKQKVIEIANRYFDGFTIIDTTGCWEGFLENGCAVVIYHDSPLDVVLYTEFEHDVLFEMNQDAITREIDNNPQFINRNDKFWKLWEQN